MEFKDIWIGVIGLMIYLLLLIGGSYGAYRYGRYAERRLLTAVFMQTMEQDYYVGYGEAEKDCRAGKIR